MFKGYVGIAVRPSIAELNREHIKLKLKASKLEKERDKARSAFDKLLKEFLKLQNENETLASHPLRLDNNDYELVIEMLKLELKECQQNSERFQFLKDWCGCMRVEYIASLIRSDQDPDKFIEQIDKEIAILNKDKND